MKKLQLVVKKWYEALDESKMMAFRCNRCGAYEFPPVYCCNSCSGTDMEWTEISGNAKLLDFVLPSPFFVQPENEYLMPYCLGSVELEEGPRFNALVPGVSKENKKEMNDKLPIPLIAETVQRDGFKTIIFRIREQEK